MVTDLKIKVTLKKKLVFSYQKLLSFGISEISNSHKIKFLGKLPVNKLKSREQISSIIAKILKNEEKKLTKITLRPRVKRI